MKKAIKVFMGLCLLVGASTLWFHAPQKAPDLSIVGFVKKADGLGRICPDLIDVLHKDFEIGFYPLAKTNPAFVPKHVLNIVNRPNKTLGKMVLMCDQPWRPQKKGPGYGALSVFKTKKNNDQIRFCYCMLESDRIPEKWAEVLNDYFDAACVPDPFFVHVFKDSGVTIPVFVIPQGLDLSKFSKLPIKSHHHKVFRFGCVGLLVDRKNQLKLIEAFDLAFNKDPKVELVIQSRFAQPQYKQSFIKKLQSLNNPMITYSESVLDDTQYLEFMQSLDMFVNISKGEGYSVQPREAMALGVPRLLSDNTAQSTLADQAYVIKLQTPLKQPSYYTSLKQYSGNHYDCEVQELAKVLKQAYQEKDTHLEHALENRHYVMRFDQTHISQLYKHLLRPSSVRLGNENKVTPSGVETTSEELLEKYQRLVGTKE